ncbi:hypothetical protein [Streptomyces canus]|uniref:hypothetical protein n=1 Tax=Streptomyces canus TaxID=58343 RepID=UPI00225BDC0E|nr:hypothetical protein [Streptomyces canus]MCX4858954.1 hypothetical protein [Streptomyces canus]
MRRILIPVAAILLASSCTSGPTDSPRSSDRATASPSAASSGAKGLTGGVPTPSGSLTVAISKEKLPYKPEAGMPALDDVKVVKTAADPCGIPADGSGQQAQLLGAVTGGPRTVNVTYSFTNPCAKPVMYEYELTVAIGGPDGEQAGGGAQGATQKIEPGETVKQVVPVDVDDDLTAAQQAKLWVGVTKIGKQDPGY